MKNHFSAERSFLAIRLMAMTFVVLLLLGCKQEPSVFSYSLENLEGEMITLSEWKGQKATVLVTLSPDCPLCQKYSLSFRQLDSAFSAEGVVFLGIFPGEYYSVDEMKDYVRDYEIPFECVLDTEMTLTKRLKAQVTPEVFVYTADEKLVYSGAIDNWAVTVRKHRQVVNEFYLRDALNSVLSGTEVEIKNIVPVGCLIQ